MLILLILGFAVLLFVATSSTIGFFLSAPRYRGPVSDHFDGTKFFTPGGAPAKGLPDVFRWMIARRRSPWNVDKNISFGQAPPPRVGRGVRITFVNHSTFLIQADGMNILTDPVWSERTSPFQWAGPKRMRPPGIRFEDLPKIDLVLLSHNHYDHLDIQTIKRLHQLHKPKIVTALGIKPYLAKHGIYDVYELDWWDEWNMYEGLRIQSVPAQHFSGRGMYDRDATLWCGFVITRMGGNIYFAGDSGYQEQLFRKIGERCAPIRLALIPIGAFKPEWFMSPIHCSPKEAVKIHKDIGSSLSIATHFGTFPLADDNSEEALAELSQARKSQGVSDDEFITMKEGEAIAI
jgi:L-ascorbate metabolism protein UlaG (beta-lactamase superfamily)